MVAKVRTRISEALKSVRRFVLVALSPALSYGLAGIAALAAVGARSALDPVLGPYSQFPLGSLAVIVAARFGGRGPGLRRFACPGARCGFGAHRPAAPASRLPSH